jgi:hypothetical protein
VIGILKRHTRRVNHLVVAQESRIARSVCKSGVSQRVHARG